MLSPKQISEIKEFLDKTQNPLFFFDNDPDGLCSFLLLRRFIGRGKGYPIKSAPLNEDYIRKVEELTPDSIFILDVPLVSAEFFQEVEKKNIPIVWIDHHRTEGNHIPSFVNYFNPVIYPILNTF